MFTYRVTQITQAHAHTHKHTFDKILKCSLAPWNLFTDSGWDYLTLYPLFVFIGDAMPMSDQSNILTPYSPCCKDMFYKLLFISPKIDNHPIFDTHVKAGDNGNFYFWGFTYNFPQTVFAIHTDSKGRAWIWTQACEAKSPFLFTASMSESWSVSQYLSHVCTKTPRILTI